MSIKEKLESLKLQRENINRLIVDSMENCTHENKFVKDYRDYDKNCVMVKCLDCNSILFDDTKFNYGLYNLR